MAAFPVVHRLAVVIRSPSDEEFLVAKQLPPDMPVGEEYQSYLDSDLWDLPSAALNFLEGESESSFLVESWDAYVDSIDLRKFNVESAVAQVLAAAGMEKSSFRHWKFLKHVEEPEFGPDHRVHTLFIHGSLVHNCSVSSGLKWMSILSLKTMLVQVERKNGRLGPLVVSGLLADSSILSKFKINKKFLYQEYPLGVIALPMGSRTGRPFRTTNLVVIAPDTCAHNFANSGFSVYGDALIVDPGCHSALHPMLEEIVTALPRKLVVFVTHHHHDHVDGLSVIQRCNPDAVLIAHERTMSRIGKDLWHLPYTPVCGDERICIAGHELEVIAAPGHTDGHMALLHTNRRLLIVGDHCVGHGSAVLDIRSGGNMRDYFQTTYKFLGIQPHALLPMHGRINVWPMQMLCSYLNHRRDRENSILKVVEDGAETLYDIVAKCYADVDPILWVHASSNVRLHVDHLALQGKLPKGFSVAKFRASCGLMFLVPCIWRIVRREIKVKHIAAISLAIAAVGIAMLVARH
ncbi:uncharacterized protein LOC116264153 isoform X2 [Nymphaea colorata]|nr:uncharacterized protein LOC116264153 isoform X2 [Nymphaea colorata]